MAEPRVSQSAVPPPEQTPVETGEKDFGAETTEQTPETAPSTGENLDTAPSTDTEPTTAPGSTTADEAPAKPTTKEKITGILHQTQDKIKGSVAGVKEKVSSKK